MNLFLFSKKTLSLTLLGGAGLIMFVGFNNFSEIEDPQSNAPSNLSTSSKSSRAHQARIESALLEKRVIRREKAIPGRYIVVYKNSQGSISQDGDEVEVEKESDKIRYEHGGQIKDTFKNLFKGAVVEMPDTEAEMLATDSAVAFVVQDSMTSIDGTQPLPPWGLDRIDSHLHSAMDRAYSYSDTVTGAGVNVFVLDTGVLLTHTEFSTTTATGTPGPPRAKLGATFISATNNPALNPIATINQDLNGHGTHVAGIIGGKNVGVAKGVNIISVKVVGADGKGFVSDAIAGLDWIKKQVATGGLYANAPAVLNMSLGNAVDVTLDAAVESVITAGITVIAAAGNDAVNACTKSPARSPNVITVGSVGYDDFQSTFSNFGTCIDIYAPGEVINSANYLDPTKYVKLSGTSMATPHVTGVAALYLSQTKTLSPAQVRLKIVSNSTLNILQGLGVGSPNLLLYSGVTPAVAAPTEFLTSGSYNWTPPVGAKNIWLECWGGGGGGGGAGSQFTNGGFLCAGGGGGGGAYSFGIYSAKGFPTALKVSIGAGGGGGGMLLSNSNGLAGGLSKIGSTGFLDFLTAYGGGGGGGCMVMPGSGGGGGGGINNNDPLNKIAAVGVTGQQATAAIPIGASGSAAIELNLGGGVGCRSAEKICYSNSVKNSLAMYGGAGGGSHLHSSGGYSVYGGSGGANPTGGNPFILARSPGGGGGGGSNIYFAAGPLPPNTPGGGGSPGKCVIRGF